MADQENNYYGLEYGFKKPAPYTPREHIPSLTSDPRHKRPDGSIPNGLSIFDLAAMYELK